MHTHCLANASKKTVDGCAKRKKALTGSQQWLVKCYSFVWLFIASDYRLVSTAAVHSKVPVGT